MNLRVVVVGVPGVGKTTVVGRLASLVKGASLVTFGTVMLEEGVRLRWIKHRDELRRMAVAKQRKLQAIAAAKIARMKRRILFVDTHLFIRTREGFWPGLPSDVVKALKPTHLILVEASPDEVLTRRSVDKSRYRDDLSPGDLESELALARSFMATASTLTGAPMLLVNNRHGRSEQVASELAEVLTEASA